MVYEVLQNGVVVCSHRMKLTKWQAENKVENEQRMANGTMASWTVRKWKPDTGKEGTR